MNPTPEVIEAIGPMPDWWPGQDFGLRLDAEYVVLGVFVSVGGPHFGRGAWTQYKNVDGRMGQAPLIMFEIVDGRISAHWMAVKHPNGAISLGPPSFNRDYYMEDYYEGVPEIVLDFERVCELLEAETAEPRDGPTGLN